MKLLKTVAMLVVAMLSFSMLAGDSSPTIESPLSDVIVAVAPTYATLDIERVVVVASNESINSKQNLTYCSTANADRREAGDVALSRDNIRSQLNC